MKSREEIRFLTLLAKTQDKTSKLKKLPANPDENNEIDEDSCADEWRLPKFVETLDEWLQSLERHPQGPSKDVFVEYKAKVDFLKKILESRAQSQNESRNPKKTQINDVPDIAGGMRRRSLRSLSPPTVSEIINPMPNIPHGPATTGDAVTTEIHQKTIESLNDRNRAALFGGPDDDATKLRKRNLPDNDSNDLEYLMKAHHQAQEQVAEDMLSLTKTLKEQSLAAKDVIQKDTAVIEKAAENADKNTERLKKEADRLEEHTKSSCRCWIWMLLGIVIMTFVSMVWVMKFFRKRKDY